MRERVGRTQDDEVAAEEMREAINEQLDTLDLGQLTKLQALIDSGGLDDADSDER